MYMVIMSMFVTLAGLFAVKSTTDRVETKAEEAKHAAKRVEEKVDEIEHKTNGGLVKVVQQVREAERDQIIDDPQTRIRLEAFIEKILDARENREKNGK